MIRTAPLRLHVPERVYRLTLRTVPHDLPRRTRDVPQDRWHRARGNLQTPVCPRNYTRSHCDKPRPLANDEIPYPQLQLSRNPLPLCTYRASCATASTHLHGSSVCPLDASETIVSTETRTRKMHTTTESWNHAPTRMYHWVRGLGNDIRSFTTHMKKKHHAWYVSITSTIPITRIPWPCPHRHASDNSHEGACSAANTQTD